MIKQLPGNTHTTGCNPNSAVTNAMQVAKIAAQSQWKKNQSIPPPPLPSRPSSGRVTKRAAGDPSQNKQGLKKVSNAASEGGSQVSSLLARKPQTTPSVIKPPAPSSAKKSAVSSDTPDWFHMNENIPVATIRLQDQHKYNQENVKEGHHSGDSSGNKSSRGENPNSTQAMMSTSHQMPPQFKVPFKRGRTMRIPSPRSAGEQIRIGSGGIVHPPPRSLQSPRQDESYYVRRAGLNPRDAYISAFHRDVHDGDTSHHKYVVPKEHVMKSMPDHRIEKVIGNSTNAAQQYYFLNPNKPENKSSSSSNNNNIERNAAKATMSRDISAFSDDCPDWMHIPMVPVIPSHYKTGVGGAEVISGANNSSSWLRYDHSNPNVKLQHPHDITVNSEAAPIWMHSPRRNLDSEQARGPMKWRKPEPRTTAHNISTAHGRSLAGERSHNYHYLRHPDKQIVHFEERSKYAQDTRSKKDGTYSSIPHASVVSKYGPEHFHIKGVPLIKFQVPKSDPQGGPFLNGTRPMTADAPPTSRRSHPSARRGAISYDAPPHMRVPGIKVNGHPIGLPIEPTVYGKNRKPMLRPEEMKQITRKKQAIGRRLKPRAMANMQQRRSAVLGGAPSHPDGTPLRPKPTSLKQQATMKQKEQERNPILGRIPTRPSTSSNDGRDGIYLGSGRCSSRRTSAKLSVPYATHYPLDPNAPVPFWEKMATNKIRQSQGGGGQGGGGQQQQQQQQQQQSAKTGSSGKENGGLRQATRTNTITQESVTNSKNRKIAALRAELTRLEAT